VGFAMSRLSSSQWLTGGALVAGAYWLFKSWKDEREMQQRIEARRALHKKMTLEPRDDWTLHEIARYTGSDPELPILTAIDGEVYNVWRGSEWYGPEGPYHSIAGRDSTRFLAKQILEEEEDDGQPLDAMEIDTLNGWKEHFNFKYDKIGKLRDDGDAPALSETTTAAACRPAVRSDGLASSVQLAESREDAATIRKAMAAVRDDDGTSAGNQVRRWVIHKEAHCARLISRVQEMLLALDPESPGYTEGLLQLQAVQQAAMKCKQTCEETVVDGLCAALDRLG